MKYHGYLISHGGHIRRNNEDNAYLNGHYRKDDRVFFWEYDVELTNDLIAAVFDGMGGEEHGEVASRLAAETMAQMLQERNSGTIMEAFLTSANGKILQFAGKRNVGTTYAALVVENDQVFFQNVGDSRGYLYRNGRLKQMTKDHNMVQELLKCGVLSKEQAARHPDRHAVYQFLGMQEEEGEEVLPEPYQSEIVSAKAGDQYLLCTDGLTEMAELGEIEKILSFNIEGKQKVDCLLNLALEHGGKDNVTLQLFLVEES